MDRKDIQQLAKLARLQLSDENADEVAGSITDVLAFVGQLVNAKTDNIAPMAHPLDALQVLRADEVTETNVREAMQAIAPATENGLYLVPKVID